MNLSVTHKLPFHIKIAYACGMMGWSVLINLIGVILVYFYVPPANSGLKVLIGQGVIFGAVNLISLITVGGRLLDAVYDPLIAKRSDGSTNPSGRRIPFMKWAILPSVVFCFLVFFPWVNSQSGINALGLSLCLVLFYFSSTTYLIPYSALLPELAPDSRQKVELASWQSVGYVMGIGISSNTFNLADTINRFASGIQKMQALQLAILCMCVLGGLSMLVTVLFINEKKYSRAKPSSVKLWPAIRHTLHNPHFRLFVVADFSFFMAVTIITSGLMYFVTVLLGLPEDYGNKLMMTMVLVSFLFYPVINYLANSTGKKIIVVISFFLLGLVFLGLYFLGKPDVDPATQIYFLVAVVAIPVASLNILPNAILSEIIVDDSRKSGENQEAVFFAVRYFFVKLAQTAGIGFFSMLLSFGKDPGNDNGIRLNGLMGFVLCISAGLIFLRFKGEKKKSNDSILLRK